MRLESGDFLSVDDLSATELAAVLDLARKMKAGEDLTPSLHGKSVALVFEHPSLRTRTCFEVGINQLGGHSVYLSPDDVQFGKRESVADIARNLERWVAGIVA